MFESTVIWALNKYLGEYVEKFDKSMLSINMMKGNVELSDLTLSPSALASLDLPLTIAWGRLGRLNISLSWTKLLSKPVVIELDEIYLMAESIADLAPNKELDNERELEIKRKVIAGLESAAEKSTEADVGDTAKTQFRVLNNVQIVVKRIHIRYEDKGHSPFACGLMLKELSARSADDRWDIIPLGDDPAIARKRLYLSGFATYWSCLPEEESMYCNKSKSQKLEFCKKSFDDQSLEYIVKPIDASGRVQINKEIKKDENGTPLNPRHQLNVDFKPIEANVNALQYKSVLGFADYFAWLTKRSQFRHLRPQVPVKGNAKIWWKYALNSELIDIRRRYQPWDPVFLAKRSANRKKYTNMYIKVCDDKKLDKSELAEVDRIELEQTANDIFLWRTRARSILATKKAKAKAAKAESGGWFSWGKKKQKGDEKSSEPDLNAEAQQFRELFANESEYEEVHHKNWEALQVGLTFAKISAALFDVDVSQRGQKGYTTEILAVGFEDSQVKFAQRPAAEAMKVEALLGQLYLKMLRHDGSFSNVITPLRSRALASQDVAKSTLQLLFETKPIVAQDVIQPDVKVRLNVNPVEFYVTAPGAKRVMTFFGDGSEAIQTSELGELYSGAVVAFESQSRAGLQHLSEERQIIDAEITVEAPVIVLPAHDDTSPNTLTMIIDLGVLELKSILPEKADDLQNRSMDAVRDAAYDKFDISLTNVQALLTKRGDDWSAALQKTSTNMHLLDRIDVSLQLHKCLQDYDTELAKFRISGTLPQLELLISGLQIRNLIELGKALADEFAPEQNIVNEVAQNSPQSILPVTAGKRAINEITNSQLAIPAEIEAARQKKALQKRMMLALDKALQVNFRIEKVGIRVLHDEGNGRPILDVMAVQLRQMTLQAITRKWDQDILFGLGQVVVECSNSENTTSKLIYAHGDNFAQNEDAHNFGTIELKVCDEISPLFEPRFDSTKTKVNVTARVFEVTGDQTTLCSTLSSLTKIVKQIEGDIKSNVAAVVDVGSDTDTVVAEDQNDSSTINKLEISKVSKNVIDVFGNFSFERFSVTLSSPEGPLFDLNISSLESNFVSKANGQMKVSAMLNKLELEDVASPSSCHSKIISILNKSDNGNLVQVHFEDYGKGNEVGGNTGRLIAQVGELQCIFLMMHVHTLVAFIDPIVKALDPLQTVAMDVHSDYKAIIASKLVIRSDEIVNEEIQATVQMLKSLDSNDQLTPSVDDNDDNVPKIGLDVTLQAPLIIVPQSQTSTHAIALKLGSVSVQNHFEHGTTAVQDNILIRLNNFNLAKVDLDVQSGMSNTLRKLFVISQVDVNIKRCVKYLVAEWDEIAPLALDVLGTIGTVNMSLHQPDLSFVMSILDTNIQVEAPFSGGDLKRAESTESLYSMNTSSSDLEQDLDGFDIDESSESNHGSIFNNIICTAPSSNGLHAKVTVGSIGLCLVTTKITGAEVPFAELNLLSIAAEHTQDDRGLKFPDFKSYSSGVTTAHTTASIETLVVVDQRTQDNKGTSMHVIKSTAAKLLDVTIFQKQQALQIVGLPTEQIPADSKFVPLHPQTMAEWCTKFGAVEGVFAGGNNNVKTATIEFSEMNDLEASMRYLQHHRKRYADYISHANWEPNTAHTSIKANFEGLQMIVAADFLVSMLNFAKIESNGSTDDENISSGGVKSSSSSKGDSVGGRTRTCHLRGDTFSIQTALTIKFAVGAQFTIAERLTDPTCHRINAIFQAGGNVVTEGDTNQVMAQISKLLVESGTELGEKQKIIPSANVTLSLRKVGDESTKVHLVLSELHLSASVEDLNLLMRIQNMITIDDGDYSNDFWSPKPVKVLPAKEVSSESSTVDAIGNEHAFAEIGVLNVVLIDTSLGQRVPLLVASIGAQLDAKNWSSNLHADCTATMAVSSYDQDKSAWHPLLIAATSVKDQVRPILVRLSVRVPETAWLPDAKLPANNMFTIKCIHSNKSSLKAAVAMLNSNPKVYWDAGGKSKNYAVFDFGMPVKLFGFKYSAVNLAHAAPKSCELYMGNKGHVNADDWVLITSFEGPSPSRIEGATAVDFTTEEEISAKGQYLKWIIKSRHARGSAKIISVGFNIRGEGGIQNVIFDQGVEATLPSHSLMVLQRAFSNIVYTGTKQQNLQNAVGDVHEVLNETGFTVAITSFGQNAPQLVKPKERIIVTLLKEEKEKGRTGRTARAVQWDDETNPNVHVPLSSFMALSKLVEDDVASSAYLVFEVKGWEPAKVSGLSSLPSVQYAKLKGRANPGEVRLAVSVSSEGGMKRITLSSPCLFVNRMSTSLELSCSISSISHDVDTIVEKGSTSSFALGKMDEIVNESLVPLLRFENVRTGCHFYTTDSLEISKLHGDSWEQESVLGFIFQDAKSYASKAKAVNQTSMMEIWGSIPNTYRSVSRLVAVKSNNFGENVEQSSIHTMMAKGLRILGYGFPCSDHTAKDSQFSVIIDRYDEAIGNHSFLPSSTTSTKKGAFALCKSHGMIRARPAPHYPWSTDLHFPRKSAMEESVHLLFTPSPGPGQPPFVCALRSDPSTSKWIASPLLAVKNTLPYRFFCGLCTNPTEVPSLVHTVAAGDTIDLSIGDLPTDGSLYLRVSLLAKNVIDDNIPEQIEVDPQDWGTGLLAAKFGGESPLGDCLQKEMTVSFQQRGVEHNLLFQIHRTVASTDDDVALATLSIYCPYIIYNESGLDIDIFTGKKNAYSSIWRPDGVKFSEPGLFSPVEGRGNFESVTFTMFGMASESVPLYQLDGVRTLSMTRQTFSTRKDASYISDILIKKIPADDELFNVDEDNDDLDVDSATVSTSWGFDDHTMMSRKVYIQSCFIVRNFSGADIRVVRKPRTDPFAFQLQHTATKYFLRTENHSLPAHGQLEVHGSGNKTKESFWRIVVEKHVHSLAGFDENLLAVEESVVTYGSQVVLFNRELETFLHSHDRNHPGGTKQKEVTSWKSYDSGDHWFFAAPRISLIAVGPHSGGSGDQVAKFVQVPPELSSLLEEGAAVVSPRPVNKMDGKDAPTFHVQLFDKSTNLAVTRIDPNAKANNGGWTAEIVLEIRLNWFGRAIQSTGLVRLEHVEGGGFLCLSHGVKTTSGIADGEISVRYVDIDGKDAESAVRESNNENEAALTTFEIQCRDKYLLNAQGVEFDKTEWPANQTDVDILTPDGIKSPFIPNGESFALGGSPTSKFEWTIETASGSVSSKFDPTIPSVHPTLRLIENSKFFPLQLQMASTGPTTVVEILRPAEHPPFRMENRCSSVTIYLRQIGTDAGATLRLLPDEMVGFTPHDASASAKLELTVNIDDEPNSFVYTFDPNNPKLQFDLGDHGDLYAVKYNDKTTGSKVMVFCKYIGQARISCGLDPKIPTERFIANARLQIPWIGVSLIDSAPMSAGDGFAGPNELLYLRASGIDASMTTTTTFKTMRLSLGNIEVDFSDRTTQFPVLLTRKNALNDAEQSPFLQVQIAIKLQQVGTEPLDDRYEYIGIAMQEIIAQVDLSIVDQILNFMKSMTDNDIVKAMSGGTQVDSSQASKTQVEPALHFKEVKITPIKAQLDINGESYSYIPNLSDFTIHLPSIELENQYMPLSNLIQHVAQLFQSEVIAYMLKFGVWDSIFSVGFLGDTKSMVKSFGGGFKQALYDPAEAALKGDEEFGTAFGMGAVGLSQSLAGGTFGLVANVTKRTGTLVASLTFDKEYQQERREAMKKNKGVASGVANGAFQFGKGIATGVSGIFLDPIKGAKKGGALGMLKGVGTGITGLVAKPIVGTVDLVASSMAGVEAAVGPKKVSYSICRPIRRISPIGVIGPYSYIEAWGAEFLYKFDRKLLASYISHINEEVEGSKDEFRLLFILEDRILESSFKNDKLTHRNVINLSEVIGQVAIKTSPEVVQPDAVKLQFADTSTSLLHCTVSSHLVHLIEAASVSFTHGFKYDNLNAHFPTKKVAVQIHKIVEDRGGVVQEGTIVDLRCWERMRYYPIKGWSHSMLPTDNGPWVAELSQTVYKDLNDVLPPAGWIWAGAWRRDDSDGGKDGWLFATDWPRNFAKKKGFSDFVKKRLWVRSVKCTLSTSMTTARASVTGDAFSSTA